MRNEDIHTILAWYYVILKKNKNICMYVCEKNVIFFITPYMPFQVSSPQISFTKQDFWAKTEGQNILNFPYKICYSHMCIFVYHPTIDGVNLDEILTQLTFILKIE